MTRRTGAVVIWRSSVNPQAMHLTGRYGSAHLLSGNEAGLESKDAYFRSGPGPDAIDEPRHQIPHGICRDAEEDCKFIVGVAIETELRGPDIFCWSEVSVSCAAHRDSVCCVDLEGRRSSHTVQCRPNHSG